METIRKIRLAARDKKSIRQISRDLRLSRNTVRKVLRSGETRFKYHRETVHCPRLAEYVERLEGLLEAEESLPVKQRRTMLLLYEANQDEGYRGGYDTVRRYVKSWREAHSEGVSDVYVPLSFDPGEAFQFDWSYETVVLGGNTTEVKVAQFRLAYSRLFLVIAYLRESQEMLFDAHRRWFEFIGGVTQRVLIDNMKTAVTTILRGKERDFNRRYEELSSHYLFEPVACTPAAGWEKGQVENQVGTTRRRLFIPRRHANDLAGLNEALLAECVSYAKRHRHPDQRSRTVWEVYEEERPSLQALPPRAFDGYRMDSLRASPTSLIRFDRNRYSVEARAAGKVVELRSYAERVRVYFEDECVADHRRLFGRDQTVFDPWHYLPVLQRKPGALRNGAPFKDWALPVAIERTLARLKSYDDWDRQSVDILAMVPVYGLETVAGACDQALLSGSVTRDRVLNLLSRANEEEVPEPIETPAHLELREPPLADCARYDHLRRQELINGAR